MTPGWWQHRRALRIRLAVLLAAMLLTACAAVGVATTLALRSYLVHRLDDQLALAGSRYAAALEHNDGDGDNAVETSTVGQAAGTLGARFANGRLTAVGVTSPTDKPVAISDADRRAVAALSQSRGSRTVQLPVLGTYRVLVAPGRDGDVLLTGLPTHSVAETVHHTIYAETAVFVVVVAVMAALGAFAVQRSLRPLENVTATAVRVSNMPLTERDVRLAERVPEVDPDTEAGQVATAVNHMLDRVDDALAERQRSEDRLRHFIADASHELRTPLSVVRSHSELLQRLDVELPENVTESLRRIDSEAGRMSRLVDDLLLLARLDSGQPLERQPVDLSLVAIDAITDARVAGPDHRWQLELPEEAVTVLGDRHRLHQVVANLLSNARTHTPPGTVVTVGLAEPDAETVLLSVHDTGPGIPAALQATVTDRFVRGDTARTRHAASTGLGLAIASGVVAAHGGSLDIESRPGDTTVWVRLPAVPATPSDSGAGSR